ncbi:hypothetical protein ANCDUO_16984, partial [Ancylostoma duodenale]
KKSPFFSQTSVVNFCENFLGIDGRRGTSLEDALRNRRSVTDVMRQLKDFRNYLYALKENQEEQSTIQWKYWRLNASEMMIKECQLPPLAMKKHVDELMSGACLDNSSPYLQEWGRNAFIVRVHIKISSRPMRAVAKRFFPPAISYGGSMNVQQNHHGDLQWRLGAREQFSEPARLDGKWSFIIFDRCVRTSDAQNFVDALSKYSSQHGVQISSRHVDFHEVSSEVEGEVETMMKKMSGNVKFVMFTTKIKLDPVHDIMKRFEAQYGVITQHVSQQTLMKAIGQKGAFMVLGNLCLKLNLKLGGVNHNLR